MTNEQVLAISLWVMSNGHLHAPNDDDDFALLDRLIERKGQVTEEELRRLEFLADCVRDELNQEWASLNEAYFTGYSEDGKPEFIYWRENYR